MISPAGQQEDNSRTTMDVIGFDFMMPLIHLIYPQAANVVKIAAMKRRSFLKMSAGMAGLAWVGDLGFLSKLRPVSAAEARLAPKMVQLHPEIEPLVKLLEDSPR